MCTELVEEVDKTTSKSLYQCLLRALERYEAGLERGDYARNQFVLDLQPIVSTLVSKLLNVHRIPYLKQDREDIITEINLLLLGRVYTKIREMRGKYKRKAGYGRARTQSGRRTPRVVWSAIRRAIWSYFKWYVNKRLNDYPMIVDEDRSEVFELFATDDGKAAREMEQELDRAVVEVEIRRKVQEHLGCRRRPEVVREVVEKVAQIAMWERYSNCDALAADWT